MILNHYPPVIKQIKDIQQIAKAEDIEFTKLNTSITEVIRNMFVFTADETGVKRFEKLLGITPKAAQSLDDRKIYIISMMNRRKMSLEELTAMLSNYSEGIRLINDMSNFEMIVEINTDAGSLETINSIIDEILPLNIYFEFALQRELGIGSAHTPHPAFIINDKVVPYIYVSKYINVIKNNRAYSIPNQDPANCITFDRAVEVCYNKGAGWHLMTAAEWGVLHNLITAQGLEPRGNTNNGRHHVKTYEHGVLSPQNPTNVYRTLTGTGGKAWEALGVCDIMGDVHKWVVARLVDGEIQIVPNNNAAIHKTDLGANSKAWKAILQDGSLVAPGTNGTLKFDYTGNPANATSGFHITTTVEHKQTDDGAGYGAKDFGTLTAKSGVTIPDILKALALFPNTDKTGRGFIYFRNNGERLLIRGGTYGDGGCAGEAFGDFNYPRSLSYVAVGLFSAYVDPALYA